MVCEHATRAELSGLADGELAAEERRWWDEHLQICPACREALARIQSLRTALRHHLPPREPSSAFREELRQLIRSGETSGPRPVPLRRRTWPMALGGALAATLVFALGLGVGRATDGGAAGDPILAQVVAGHVRSLEVDHLVDVASSEHHVVKPWFAGKLDFSPPVPELAQAGFPLAGGRVDYIGGRQVAALVYRGGPHYINLLIWPAAGAAASRCDRDAIVVRQGFNLAHGHAAGMELWAISDLNRQELEKFVVTWQRMAAPGEVGCG
jgi:anti-sigma factor RsiW